MGLALTATLLKDVPAGSELKPSVVILTRVTKAGLSGPAEALAMAFFTQTLFANTENGGNGKGPATEAPAIDAETTKASSLDAGHHESEVALPVS